MPRRSGVPKRDVLPDPMYNSKVITKLTNQVMLDGKKGTAQSIVYEAFDIVKEKTGGAPEEIFLAALETQARARSQGAQSRRFYLSGAYGNQT